MSRSDIAPAYTCGTYHRRGRAGCTSHHIRVDKLDELMRLYIRRVMDGSAEMLDRLNAELAREDNRSWKPSSRRTIWPRCWMT